MSATNHDLLVEDYVRAERDRVHAIREGHTDRRNQFLVEMKSALDRRQMRAEEFDFGKLFVACFGLHEFYQCKEGKQSPQDVFQRFAESDAGVNTSAFQNISGQIIYGAARVEYESEEYIFAKIVPEQTALILDGEKIPGITNIGNVMVPRKEGDPYKEIGFGEDWIFTPAVPDIGGIVSVTWEAIFNDRTGNVLTKAGEGGKAVGLAEEISAIDAFIDENTTAHRYNWKTFGQIATFDDNTGSHTWDNLAASNALVDWTDVDAAEQVFNAITDPYTGLPVLLDPTHIVVTKQLEQTARRIVSATELRFNDGASNTPQTIYANPYLNKYQVLTSRLLGSRLATDTSWFLAAPAEMLLRMVAEPFMAIKEPSNSKDDFERRIVARYRTSKRWAHVVKQPRHAVKSTA